jgi:hypothetical protein
LQLLPADCRQLLLAPTLGSLASYVLDSNDGRIGLGCCSVAHFKLVHEAGPGSW